MEIFYLTYQPRGVLEIKGKGTNVYGNITVYTRFMLNLVANTKSSPTPVINQRTVLPVGSVIGHITHYGTEVRRKRRTNYTCVLDKN